MNRTQRLALKAKHDEHVDLLYERVKRLERFRFWRAYWRLRLGIPRSMWREGNPLIAVHDLAHVHLMAWSPDKWEGKKRPLEMRCYVVGPPTVDPSRVRRGGDHTQVRSRKEFHAAVLKIAQEVWHEP